MLTHESHHIRLKGIFLKEVSGSEGKASNILGYTNWQVTGSFAWSQSAGETWQAQVRSYSEIKKKEISVNPQVWIQKNILFRSKGKTHFSYKIISIRGQGETSVSTSTHSPCRLTWNPHRKLDAEGASMISALKTGVGAEEWPRSSLVSWTGVWSMAEIRVEWEKWPSWSCSYKHTFD